MQTRCYSQIPGKKLIDLSLGHIFDPSEEVVCSSIFSYLQFHEHNEDGLSQVHDWLYH
jgi:hypothetical protein